MYYRVVGCTCSIRFSTDVMIELFIAKNVNYTYVILYLNCMSIPFLNFNTTQKIGI